MEAVNISPLDGDSSPSCSMLPFILEGREIDMEKRDFWKCVQLSMIRLRESIERKRAIEFEKLKNRGK